MLEVACIVKGESRIISIVLEPVKHALRWSVALSGHGGGFSWESSSLVSVAWVGPYVLFFIEEGVPILSCRASSEMSFSAQYRYRTCS